MRKRILLYAMVIVSVCSLESCVSNYVVSKPMTPTKSEAQLASINKENSKKSAKQTTTFELLSQAERDALIAKEIKKSQTLDGILDQAMTYLGTPYRFGGTTRSGIDCSAFVLSVFNESVGMSLPRVSADQSQEGEMVDKSELEKGDLIFFSTSRGGRISHVGIVQEVSPEGDIKFIHSSSSRGVAINSLNEKYWSSKYRFAKRVLKDEIMNY